MKLAAPLFLGLLALAASLAGLRFAAAEISVAPLRTATVEPTAQRLPAPAAEPIAVIELFTSEGCSSCPPADRLLRDLAARNDARLFPLAFHVDYWNRLGWRDPFSDAAYSQRQRAYARAVGTGRVYTPQMIVNGQREFVGSRRGEAERAIQQTLDVPVAATVDLRTILEGRAVSVDYAVANAPDDAVLHLALVQCEAEQDVARGENAGRTLRHANVVRAFETVPAKAGRQVLALPDGMTAMNAAVVGYAQDPATMKIVAANRIALAGE
jgi:hypothetical protein